MKSDGSALKTPIEATGAIDSIEAVETVDAINLRVHVPNGVVEAPHVTLDPLVLRLDAPQGCAGIGIGHRGRSLKVALFQLIQRRHRNLLGFLNFARVCFSCGFFHHRGDTESP